jgi:hypothetical protein
MSFVIRPLFAIAALALATPAFAQVNTTATSAVTTPAAQTATKTDVKAPAATVKTDTAVKTDGKMKTEAKAGTTAKTEKSSKADTKTKVSTNTHHHGKVTKKA